MDTTIQAQRLAKRVRTLTIAVWSLAVINALTLAVVAQFLFASPPAHLTTTITPVESWQGKSFGERARLASVVLVTAFRSDGDTLRGYIKEELRRAPGTAFDLHVGDEYRPLARKLEDNTTYGEGALVLLAGSPAEFRQSMRIEAGNVYVGGGPPGEPTTLTLSEVRRAVVP
jgi:hypothetical protein